MTLLPKNQNEKQHAFIWAHRIAIWEHRFRNPNCMVKARGFYRKRKGNNSMNREKEFLLVLAAELLLFLAIYGWLLILKNVHSNQSCSQDVCFPVSLQIVICTAVLLWPSPEVTFPSSNIPEIQGTRCRRQFLWNGCPDSILKWCLLCELFTPTWSTLM